MFKWFQKSKKSPSPKILIVDDEPDYVNTIRCRLEWNNFKVTTASNGKEGLEKAAAEKPDLILLDTSMPVMNGHEMLEHLRQDPGLQQIPVIMVTALCEIQDIERASRLGITDYVAKPFDSSELVQKIANVLKERSLLTAK
jgi:two-component system sensor histidine kinase/response regulator